MFDLQPIYRCICKNLLDRRDHIARIIGGAACEQWFSSEAFAAINWPTAPLLAAGQCGRAESRKHDLIIRDNAQRTIATVESKLVHNNKNLSSKLDELHGQVERSSKADETAECDRGGLVYAIWGDENYYDDGHVWEEHAYHDTLLSKITSLFPPEQYRHIPESGLDMIVPRTLLPWPTHPYHVSLHTKFMQRTNCAF